MAAEYVHHIRTLTDLLFAGWLVWLLYKNDALEARITKLGG